jgi:glycyl-tRNA synthetase
MEVIDPDTQEKILPHVFELSLGIDRSVYTILEHSFFQDTDNKRTVLRLNPHLAPISIGILPLMRNEDIENISRRIHYSLKRNYDTFYDVSGSIGRRYRRLEEIGVPYAITIDHASKTDNTVTIRYRDTMEQIRIKIDEIKDFSINQFK